MLSFLPASIKVYLSPFPVCEYVFLRHTYNRKRTSMWSLFRECKTNCDHHWYWGTGMLGYWMLGCWMLCQAKHLRCGYRPKLFFRTKHCRPYWIFPWDNGFIIHVFWIDYVRIFFTIFTYIDRNQHVCYIFFPIFNIFHRVMVAVTRRANILRIWRYL